MSFTNLRWSSLLGRSACLVLFALCFAGLQNATAQIVMKYTAGDSTCTTHTLASCSGAVTDASTQFTDDGTNDGNYADLHARADTTEFCPTDKWHFVKVVFTKFDLEDSTAFIPDATGDTLWVYQGNKVAVRAGLAPTAALQVSELVRLLAVGLMRTVILLIIHQGV